MNIKKATALAVLMVMLSVAAGAQDFLTGLQAHMNAAAQYDYGESRLALTSIDSMMHGIFNDPELKKEAEKAFIAFLKSDATLASKQFVSRKLSLIGGDKCVSTLSKMVRTDDTFDMALYALERIPGKKAGGVLRGLLKKAEGVQLIGVINALGMRKDVKAVPGLKKLVLHQDEATALAAIAALGRIGDDKAAKVLVAVINDVSGQRKDAVYDAYLKHADRLFEKGRAFEAGEIYQKMTAVEYPEAIRSAAMSGLIVSSQNAGATCLDYLTNGDETLQSAVIYHVGRMKKLDYMDRIARMLPGLQVAQQVQLIGALAARGDHSVADQVIAVTGSEDSEVAVAAIKALEFLGDASMVELLAGFASGKGEKADAARESLNRVKGAGMDKVFADLLGRSNPEMQAELLKSIGVRQMNGLSSTVYSLAGGDSEVKTDAMRALSVIQDPNDMVDLVNLLIETESGRERVEAENMVVAVANRAEKEAHPSEALLARLPKIDSVELRSSMLQVMGRIGDAKALPEIKKAVSSKNKEISRAGIRALSAWPDATPLTDLMNLAQKNRDKTGRILALRGFIRMIDLDKSGNGEKKVVLYRKALDMNGGANEKRLILAGLSNIRNVLAINMAGELMEDESVTSEAEAAVVKIANRIWRQHPDETMLVLKKVAGKISDEGRIEDVQEIMQAIERM
jgi:HEAT repeat protein